MNLSLSLTRALNLWPDREAIADGQIKLSYKQFGCHVYNLAASLENKGIGQGDVIAIISPNVHEFMEVYYACAISGIILTPINFRLSPREIALILQDSEAQLLIAHSDFTNQVSMATPDTKLKEVIWLRSDKCPQLSIPGARYEDLIATGPNKESNPRELESTDLAHLYYTSGTTGMPKGVMLTHGNVACHALGTIAELSLCDSDVWAHIAPMFHLADAWATFAITWCGGKHVFVPYFDPQGVLTVIEKENVTISNLIPTMLSALINDPSVKTYNFGSLRCLLSGGAPIAPDTVRRIISTFACDYVQTYGMTETSPYLTLSLLKAPLKKLPMERQLELKSRTGRPFITVDLKVVAGNGQEIKRDDSEVGEIIVKGPTVTSGYWKQPKATAEAIKDGWLYTGDLATIDADGYVNIVDRKKDMIITGGESVYSTEVEHILYEHPDILECAIIGIPDHTWGEAVKAIVVTKPGSAVGVQELIDFVKDRLAHYKAPKSVDFIDALPKTGSGKICKKDLKEPYWRNYEHRVN